MEGTYYKEWSAVLDRAMEFKVYGHGGVPVLALPARGGPGAGGDSPDCPQNKPSTPSVFRLSIQFSLL